MTVKHDGKRGGKSATHFLLWPACWLGWLVGWLAGWLGGAAGQGPDLPREEGPHDCQA